MPQRVSWYYPRTAAHHNVRAHLSCAWVERWAVAAAEPTGPPWRRSFSSFHGSMSRTVSSCFSGPDPEPSVFAKAVSPRGGPGGLPSPKINLGHLGCLAPRVSQFPSLPSTVLYCGGASPASRQFGYGAAQPNIHWVPPSRHLPPSTENAVLLLPLSSLSRNLATDRRASTAYPNNYPGAAYPTSPKSSAEPAVALSLTALGRAPPNNASRAAAEASERGSRLALGRRSQIEAAATPPRRLLYRR